MWQVALPTPAHAICIARTITAIFVIVQEGERGTWELTARLRIHTVIPKTLINVYLALLCLHVPWHTVPKQPGPDDGATGQ